MLFLLTGVLALTPEFNLSPNLRLGSEPLVLHPDRFFDSDIAVRRIARTLYDETRTLPLLCPHGHVDPVLFAQNGSFLDPTALLFTPDHYLVRMLYSAGVPLEALGLSAVGEPEVQHTPREIWRRFAVHYHRFLATPSGAWLDFQLHEVFGVRKRLSDSTGDRIYDEISEKLGTPEFRPRALFERFGIEVLATTDSAAESTEHHCTIRASGWSGRVVPTFRPDTLFEIASPAWRLELTKLEQLVCKEIDSASGFVSALAERRLYFRALGATATDHGTADAYTGSLSVSAADAIFLRARQSVVQPEHERAFRGHLLIEMARLSVESMWCVSALSGAWIETKSDRRSSSWSGTGSTPSAVILSSLTYGSYAMTWSPKALARRATAFATFPNEMRPSVWPYSRGIRLSSGQP